MNKSLTVLIFSLYCMVCHIAVAYEKNESPTLTKVNEYNLRADIITFVQLSSSAPNKAYVLLSTFDLDATAYNYAEQYLVLLAKAKIKQYQQQHQEVISLIKKTIALRKYIVEKQLNTPLFSNAHLVLATSYAAIKDFDQAYQAKKDFVDEYNDYSDDNRENTVKELTKKYEIAHKIEANELLDNQNKLKELRLEEVHKQQQDQQQQFILITLTIILFVLLFLRQLKIRKKLLFLTKTDSLTGILNRAALFNQGQKLVKISSQKELQLSLSLFDIDHFKSINDEFGHHVGDLVLEKISHLVSETMRARDVFSRLGGEEFVIILPNTDIDKAKAIAVRVMEKIADHDFGECGVNRPITLSIGVANLNETKAVFDDLLHAADLAMYQAKAQGRNQMVSYANIAEHQERRQR
ncbi:MAG: GGDEF domain-containing protein [Colwellia sp.]|nr:GGDEF domain-containing protein [Colwellia sp.]